MKAGSLENPRRIQLDQILPRISGTIPTCPKSGWIREIRDLLLLTATQLAKRLGVEQSTVSNLEKSEVKKTITLGSLERVADAMNCDVKYVFIPRESLEKQIMDQALKVLRREDKKIEHSLALEAQQTYGENSVEETIRTAFLLQERGARIWDEE